MTDSIARLRAAGVSVWLDDLSRERLRSGSLAALRDRGVSGVTTNPTIFARAISDSDAYAAQIRDLKLSQVPVDQTLRELTACGRRATCCARCTGQPAVWTGGASPHPASPRLPANCSMTEGMEAHDGY